jgi:protoheme IX farnesyltransferase
MPLAGIVSDYWRLTKPRIWGLLVFTGLVAMLVAYRETGETPTPLHVLVLAAALALGSASADVLTNYNDRDIDRMMKRTMKRALPSGKLAPGRALAFGLIMAVFSVLLAAWFNLLSAAFMLIGLIDNIVVYSILLKRRSWVSVILGGISGGMPVLVGYAAVANSVSLTALYMSTLVILWIPTHIWSLALVSKEDYAAAKIPALPVVFGDAVGTVCVAATSGLLVAFSFAIYFFTAISVAYILSVAVFGAAVMAYSAKLAFDRKIGTAWILFKMTSPYLVLVFLVLGLTK